MTTTLARASWSVPAGRLVLRADAPRDAWLAERAQGIGGSEVPVLLGASPYGSPYDVWASKTHPVFDDTPTAAMTRGTRLEPVLAQWFAEDTGVDVRRCGLVAHRAADHHRVSVDRLTADQGNLEIKSHTPFAREAAEWDGGGYSHRAWLQGQWSLHVTGRDVLWLAALVGVEFHVRGPLERDDDAIAAMVDVVDRFWTDHVLTRVPPPVDYATVTAAEVTARWPHIDPAATTNITDPALVEVLAFDVDRLTAVQSDLTDLGRRARELEKTRDGLRTRLAAAAAGAEYLALTGRPVARWATTTSKGQPLAGRIDTAALKAAMPDIAAEFTKPAAPKFTLLGDPE